MRKSVTRGLLGNRTRRAVSLWSLAVTYVLVLVTMACDRGAWPVLVTVSVLFAAYCAMLVRFDVNEFEERFKIRKQGQGKI